MRERENCSVTENASYPCSPCLRALVSEILKQVSANNMVIYSGHKAKRRSGVRKGNTPRMIPFSLPLVACTITQALVLFFNSNLKNIGLVQEAPASSKNRERTKIIVIRSTRQLNKIVQLYWNWQSARTKKPFISLLKKLSILKRDIAVTWSSTTSFFTQKRNNVGGPILSHHNFLRPHSWFFFPTHLLLPAHKRDLPFYVRASLQPKPFQIHFLISIMITH